MFPVETRYLGGMSVSGAARLALGETDGDVFCFLPGEGEIRRAAETLADVDAQVLPLFGALAKEAQDLVFEPSSRRKVILATSIAETSVTIDGVTAVVDSGLMRVSRFSPSTGMSGLVTLPLTMDRAEQRRGRAGRVRPGVCYRLWEESETRSRPQKSLPEILEADLSSLVLTSSAWGALGREDLPWMTAPAAAAWGRAKGLLRLLGAIDPDGRLTEKGRRMSGMPMHPRLANMLLGGGDPVLAAIVEEGVKSRESDIRFVPRAGRVKELARRFGAFSRPVERTMSEGSMLALAYPDRIARNRGNGTFRMVNGRGAFLDRDDPMAREQYIVCCELDDRPGDAKVFLGCPISEGEILSLFEGEIAERPICEWDRRNDCVRSVLRGELGQMPVYEKPLADGEGVEQAVLAGIRIKGVGNLPCWTAVSLQMKARIDFLHRRLGADSPWPEISDAALLGAMEGFVGGVRRWKDLEKVDLCAVMDFILAGAGLDRRELDRLAPVKMEVPSGSRMTIRYEGDEPSVQVKLQECFGLMETPKVAGGTVPVVMTLLSPAQRPIQVTKDLLGFWKGAYALVRKDMRGRYPKHYWPEDPFSAVATRRVRPPSER
jgi:ATP-dependent helicase HrpB